MGMRNSDISTTLCISPHTVKTHVYNLFRKIQVANRYEAAQWRSVNRLDDSKPASLAGTP
jgi:LuxR family transcriptional regulator of csgAB operon